MCLIWLVVFVWLGFVWFWFLVVFWILNPALLRISLGPCYMGAQTLLNMIVPVSLGAMLSASCLAFFLFCKCVFLEGWSACLSTACSLAMLLSSHSQGKSQHHKVSWYNVCSLSGDCVSIHCLKGRNGFGLFLYYKKVGSFFLIFCSSLARPACRTKDDALPEIWLGPQLQKEKPLFYITTISQVKTDHTS